jgi:cytochrome P450
MTFASILVTVLALPGILLVWSAVSFQANYAKAKKTGLPIITRYIAPVNPLWMVCGSTIVRTFSALGLATTNFRRFYSFGWEANERYQIHLEFGPLILLVTPGGNWLSVGDAEVIDNVIRHPKVFRRNMEQMSVLNVYGKNLSTTDDEEWQKHRKVTAITFTERNNELVWRESLAQSHAMLQYWKKHKGDLTKDTKVFTLNVLAAALFNKNYPFQGATELKAEPEMNSGPKEDAYNYRDSLSMILRFIIPIFVFGSEGLRAWWTPKSWKTAADAVAVFRAYVTGLINEERDHISHGNQHNQHLVAALVRACELDGASDTPVSKEAQQLPQRRTTTLTEEEIVSNLFVFAFAGNDTTAIALTHILITLSAHPEIQDWISEEINHYLPTEDMTQWDYGTFPKLKRCLAVIVRTNTYIVPSSIIADQVQMEVLRLNHPLSQLVKTTGPQSLPVEVNGKTYILPPQTNIHLNLSALHTHPQYWGENSLLFNPYRFISSPTTTTSPGSLDTEVLASDTTKTFLPWAHGQRLCPGKKFSQVELVAALATLFHNHRVQPELLPGESLDDARKRMFKTGMEINHEGTMLFEIKEPKKARLTWVKL